MPIVLQMAASVADERDRELLDRDAAVLAFRSKLGGRFTAAALAYRDSSSADSDSGASDSPARTPRTPRLRPMQLAPLNCSSDAATSRAFLSALDRVEISGVEKGDDGVTYYLVDTYRFHYTSRIPTNRLRQQLLQQQQRPSEAAASPAFRVRRRYSDFAALREAAIRRICPNAMFICPQCAAMEHYSRFGVAQPRLLVRVATGVKQRQHLLKKFLDELMALASSRNLAHAKDCTLHDQLPRLLEAFLTDAWPPEC
jgi:hypothetical protein